MCKIFSWKISCLTVPKNAVGELCSHSLVSGFEKVWIRVGGRRNGVSQNSVENFLFHNAENFCRRALLCCVSEKFQERNFSWIRRGV